MVTILPFKLMEEFDVLRVTVKESMNKLFQSGSIVRKKGKRNICFKEKRQD